MVTHGRAAALRFWEDEMQLRPYQQECLGKIVKGFAEFERQLLVLPTGAGKTICFSWLAKMFLPMRTLILCHREELIDRAIAKLFASTGIVAGKEKAEFEACKGQASKIISTLFERRKTNLATPAQVKWLTRFKHPSPHTASFAEAGIYLDKRFGKK